jgi:sugar diacid utilization regulator/GAF domain-containing protein
MPAVTETIWGINAAHDLSVVLTLIARQACELLGLKQCAIYVLQPDGQTLRLAGHHGLTRAYVDALNTDPMRLDEGTAQSGPPTVRALLTGMPVFLRDVDNLPGTGRWQSIVYQEGIRSIVAAPLQAAGDLPLGTMTGYPAPGAQFDTDQIPLLTLLSDHAAAAIVAARHRDRERAAIAELSAANVELLEHQRIVSRLHDLQQQLIRLLLRDVGLHGIADFLARELTATITIDTAAQNVLATAPADSTLQAQIYSAVDDPAVAEQIAEIFRSGRATNLDWKGPATVCLAPIAETGASRTRLWVARRSPDRFNDDERWAIEGCAMLIAVERGRIERRAEAEARLTKDLLADLLSPAAMVNPESVMARAFALGHEPHSSHTLALFVPISRGDATVRAWSTTALSAELLAAIGPNRPRAVVGAVGDSVVALLPSVTSAAALPKLVEHARHLTGGGVRCVVGRELMSLGDLQPKLAVATRAAGLLTTDSPDVMRLADFGVYGLLLEAGTTEAMVQHSEVTLAPLLAADRKRDGDLLNTIRAWTRANLSVRDTARRLFVHPNTVAYRLKRIASLTGLDLSSPADLATLHVALMIFEIRGGQELSAD